MREVWDKLTDGEILDVFSTLFHFSRAPRGFSKAFSERKKKNKKKKLAAVWWIKQLQQPLPSLPSRLPALIFQSLSVPVLSLLYTLQTKCAFSSWLLSLLRPTRPCGQKAWFGPSVDPWESAWMCRSRDVSLNPLTLVLIGSSLLWHALEAEDTVQSVWFITRRLKQEIESAGPTVRTNGSQMILFKLTKKSDRHKYSLCHKPRDFSSTSILEQCIDLFLEEIKTANTCFISQHHMEKTVHE